MPPLALQAQTCQNNNVVVKTVVQENFIFPSIRLKEVAGDIQAVERSCVRFVCPVIFIDSNGRTLCLSSSETIEENCLCLSALALKNNGRSDEAASILVLQLCLQLLPNENT